MRRALVLLALGYTFLVLAWEEDILLPDEGELVGENTSEVEGGDYELTDSGCFYLYKKSV